MPYRDIDPIIAAWAALHDLVLFSDARRFCHTSSASGECFQLVVEPPSSGSVMISAWSIETKDDASSKAGSGVSAGLPRSSFGGSLNSRR